MCAERDFALHETPPFLFPGTYHPGHNVEVWRRLLAADVLLDGPLRDRLSDGSIRLLRASWLLDSTASNPHLDRDPRSGAPVMCRHQELPQAAFFTASEALRILARRDRSILALSAAYLTPSHPDPHGSILAAVRAYLSHDAFATRCALFWAYSCIPQPPYDLLEERSIVTKARHAWGSLYGSYTATCILRCADLVTPGDGVINDDDASAVVERYPPAYLDALRERALERPYEVRVWPRYEQSVAAISAAALETRFGHLGVPERMAAAVASRPKVIDISDGEVWPLRAVDLAAMVPTSVRAARAFLAEGSCSARGERPTVRALLADYEMRIAPLGHERCACQRSEHALITDGEEPAHFASGSRSRAPPRAAYEVGDGEWSALRPRAPPKVKTGWVPMGPGSRIS